MFGCKDSTYLTLEGAFYSEGNWRASTVSGFGSSETRPWKEPSAMSACLDFGQAFMVTQHRHLSSATAPRSWSRREREGAVWTGAVPLWACVSSRRKETMAERVGRREGAPGAALLGFDSHQSLEFPRVAPAHGIRVGFSKYLQ